MKGGLDVQSLVGGSEWLSYAPELVRASDGDARQGILLDIMLWSSMRRVVDAWRAARFAEERGWDASGISL